MHQPGKSKGHNQLEPAQQGVTMNLFEAARELGVSKVTVRSWLDKSILPGKMRVSPGGQVRWEIPDNAVKDIVKKLR